MDHSSRRIVLVADRFPTPSETFIFQRFVRLIERGWDVYVCCAESLAEERAMFPQLAANADLARRIIVRPRKRHRIASIVALPVVVLGLFLRAPAATIRYLRRGWQAHGAEIVRSLYGDADVIALDPDIVHFTFGWFALGRGYLARALDAKLVVSFQGADLNYAGLDREPGYYADVWRTSSKIHFLSEDLRRRGVARGCPADDRVVVVHPGIDLDVFAPHARERTPGEPLRVLSVGRLHWKKGYGYALRTVRTLVDEGIDVRYRIVGDGPQKEAVLYDIHDLGLQDVVTLLGAQPAERTRDEMQWADVFLHAAVSEGFCYAAVEAQAMELPVVTSDADGLSENVEDARTGFVVARRDADALARAVAALARDPQLRARMGSDGRRRAVARFTVATEIDGFDALYRSVLGTCTHADPSRDA